MTSNLQKKRWGSFQRGCYSTSDSDFEESRRSNKKEKYRHEMIELVPIGKSMMACQSAGLG